MAVTRVTERSISATVLNNLQNNITKIGSIQERMSSGKQISKASDNPGGTVSSMQFRSDKAAQQQYSRNADDGLGWLGAADTALASMVERVNRVRDLTLQGVSTGNYGSADSREALATEVDDIRDALVNLANTAYTNRPVFGGTTAGTQAYDLSGTYLGDDGTVVRTVGDNTKVRVDIDGPTAFGTGSEQLFSVLKDIADNMRDNPGNLGASLDSLDKASGNLRAAQASVGARYNQITQMQQIAEDRVLSLTTQQSNVEDIDLPMTIMELQLQQTAYQAALAATAKVIQPSLVDFLK